VSSSEDAVAMQAAAAAVSPTKASPLQALLAVARNMVPDNVVLAAVNMNILGIITFSLFFGICLASLGDQADGFISLITVRKLLSLEDNLPAIKTLFVVGVCSER